MLTLRFEARPPDNGIAMACFAGDHAALDSLETDDYRHLREPDGRILPLFSVRPRRCGQVDPKRRTARRIPKSNSPLGDLLLELDRLVHYPDHPSRQRSVFANTGGFQSGLLGEGKVLHLGLPKSGARIFVSDVPDFRLSFEEQSELYRQVGIDSGARAGSDVADLFDIPADQGNRERAFRSSHLLLDLVERTRALHSGRERLTGAAKRIFSFWPDGQLIERHHIQIPPGICETLIEGDVRWIEVAVAR